MRINVRKHFHFYSGTFTTFLFTLPDTASSARSTPKLSIADSTARLPSSQGSGAGDKDRPVTPHDDPTTPTSHMEQSMMSPTAGSSGGNNPEAAAVVTSSVPMTTEPSLAPSGEGVVGEKLNEKSKEEREVRDEEPMEKPVEVRGHKPPLVLLSDSAFQILKAEIDQVCMRDYFYIDFCR